MQKVIIATAMSAGVLLASMGFAEAKGRKGYKHHHVRVVSLTEGCYDRRQDSMGCTNSYGPFNRSPRVRRFSKAVSQGATRVAHAVGAVSRAGQPSRYIAGRLICAVNVNAALAERGVKGTGSALAASFLRWGRASGPVPGAVAFNYRRGGGHVSLVDHVDAAGRVWVWNPSPRGQGWQLRVNPYNSQYRVAA